MAPDMVRGGFKKIKKQGVWHQRVNVDDMTLANKVNELK